jgi:hypothetical protein|tara:strand:+ start:313 stop:873 length:561 start_codon:yes stop_codon:yes gene_type:complete
LNQDLVPKTPLSGIGRILFALNIIGLVVIFALGLYGYLFIEGVIPTHYDFAGNPDAYGSSQIFLIMIPTLSIAPVIIILISHYRYTLINKHPYLTNLPAFYMYIPKIPFEKRGYWVNKYFEAVLALGVFTTVEMIIILWGIYIASIEEVLPNWFLPVTLLMSFIMIPPMIYYFYKLSLRMKKEMIE